jgi:hypothetical protein
MIVNRTRRAGDRLPAAGELLAVEAIDRTGLIVTSEGALVRIIRVTPRNPLLMSLGEREKTAAAFQRLVSQLGADETVQDLHRRPPGEPGPAALGLPPRGAGERRARTERRGW